MAAKSNLDDLMKSPEAAGLLKNKDMVRDLMRSPDTKKLMDMLNQKAGSGLKGAADAAMKGDTSQLMSLMDSIMKSKEGAAVIERINQAVPKK